MGEDQDRTAGANTIKTSGVGVTVASMNLYSTGESNLEVYIMVDSLSNQVPAVVNTIQSACSTSGRVTPGEAVRVHDKTEGPRLAFRRRPYLNSSVDEERTPSIAMGNCEQGDPCGKLLKNLPETCELFRGFGERMNIRSPVST